MMDQRFDADLVVVGGGISGLSAAISAAQAGASVIVIEKSGAAGGAANMGRGLFAVESKYQKAQLVNHTVDGLFKEFMHYTHWRVNAPLVRKIFQQSASTIDWIENMGVEFLGAFKYFETSNQTWHIVKVPGSNKPAPRCASVMVKAMIIAAEELGVDFHYYTSAKSLIKGVNGQIIGVRAVDDQGNELTVDCDAVIVSTGGFGDNPEMIKERMGLTWGEDLFSFRIPGLKGDGLKMVEAIGGALEPSMMEVTYTTPGVTDVFNTISEVMRQPNLMVNIRGTRIIDEGIMNNTTFTGNAIYRQPQRKAFTIVTDSILEEYMKQGGLDYVTHHFNISSLAGWQKEVEGYLSRETRSETSNGLVELHENMRAEKQFFVADSLENLCAQTSIDYSGLKKTVGQYNAMAGRQDMIFGKAPRFMRELKSGGKWYAAAHYICGYGTLAGIKTDEDLRIVDENSDPIPGLYGCGTDVCSIFGDSYNFYMPGSTMGFAINSGRLAGKYAVDYIDSDAFIL